MKKEKLEFTQQFIDVPNDYEFYGVSLMKMENGKKKVVDVTFRLKKD